MLPSASRFLPRQTSRIATRALSAAAKAQSCCPTNMPEAETYESVQNYYGKVLSTSKDLKTNACTTSARPSSSLRKAMKQIPQPILDKFYGCGNPVPTSIEGLDVLDLGSGSGRDCYLASLLVGDKGSVTGIDMTDNQLSVAREHVEAFTKELGREKPNLRFLKGHIEFIEKAGVEPNTIDLIISNCVINLSPDKAAVIRGCYNVLREGGELYFSDVYCDRRLPQEIREHDVLVGECLGGALYIEDFKRICQQTGFTDPRQLACDPIEVHDPQLKQLLGNAKFYSITYRCFKLNQLETLCEDYGQVAYYLGTIDDHPFTYALDDHHVFETNRPMLVCGNTAAMVGDSWLKKHFRVVGDTKTHYGLFDCSGAPPAAPASSGDAPPAAGCC